jgi:hypothetical protein
MPHACKLSLSNVRQVCAVTAGVVRFCMDDGAGRNRYSAFRLNHLIARAVGGAVVLPEAEFVTCRGLAAHPYFFAWPSSLQQPPHRCA